MTMNQKNITSEHIQYLFAEIAKSITGSLEVTNIVTAIMREVQIFFKPRNWSLLRLDPSTQELYFVLAQGLDENSLKKNSLKIRGRNSGLCCPNR